MDKETREYLESVEIVDGEKWIFGNVYLSSKGLKRLYFEDINIDGDFFCSYNKLQTLKGAPKRVNRRFDFSNNKIRSLKGSPHYVGEDFNAAYNKIDSLKYSPDYIGGVLYLTKNNLENLEGITSKVKELTVRNNPLKSLKGIGEISGEIYLSRNHDLFKDDYYIQYSLMDKIFII